MKVLFDAYWWHEGPTAVRHVMREIVQRWALDYPQDELTVVVRRRHLAKVLPELPPRVSARTSMMKPHALLASIATTAAARKVRPDVVLTHNFASLDKNSFVYLHDVLFKTNPEWFTPAERLYFYPMVPLARRARRVFTSSNSEAQRISSFIKPSSVRAVGLGISDELLAAERQPPEAKLESGQFILSVGRLNARKNLARAVSAVLGEPLVTAHFPLVVVGEPDGASAGMPPEVRRAVGDGSVRFLGHVTDAELHWLYSNARLLLYPSLDEGYGMPPLEALALGCPVVASDIPVFRETLGDVATFADPLSSSAIASAVATELETPVNQERIDQLIRHGRSVTWQRVVASIRSGCREELRIKV